MSESDRSVNVDTDIAYKMELINLADRGDTGSINTDNPNTDPSIASDGLILTDLPSEILFHIASFLESRTIGCSLYTACKKFYELFSSDSYWRSRILKRWPKQYPVFDSE